MREECLHPENRRLEFPWGRNILTEKEGPDVYMLITQPLVISFMEAFCPNPQPSLGRPQNLSHLVL